MLKEIGATVLTYCRSWTEYFNSFEQHWNLFTYYLGLLPRGC